MAEGITAIIFCNNEEENLRPLFATLQGIEEKIVINHLSTDKTEEIAKELGAKVITQGNVVDTVTKQDVEDFVLRFRFSPTFSEGNTVPNWPIEFNQITKLATNDWILWIDADERLEWDQEEVRKLLPDYDVIACEFKNPGSSFTCVKFARKSKTWLSCRIHSALVGYDARTIFSDKIKLTHHQRPRDYRLGYLPTLEYAFLKEEDSRSNFYLAREYYNYGELDKAIRFFLIYLRGAHDKTEITKSYTIMAQIYWRKGEEDEAFNCIYSALRTNPADKDALLLMTEMVRPAEAKIWKKFIETI